jgi:hypothetical protein
VGLVLERGVGVGGHADGGGGGSGGVGVTLGAGEPVDGEVEQATEEELADFDSHGGGPGQCSSSRLQWRTII